MSAAYVLVVDDEPDIRGLVQEILEDEGYEVATAANAAEARERYLARRPDLVLLDIWMPDVDGISLLREWFREEHDPPPVVMISGHGNVETAVEATRLGALDFLEKPLSMGKLLVTVERSLAADRQRGAASAGAPPAEVVEPVGHSRALRELRERAKRLAASDSWVLISGEPGSGKKCLARYLHSLGPVPQGPLVELAATELDEYLARHRSGAPVLQRARGGTLLLDEVAALDPEAQARLLGALHSADALKAREGAGGELRVIAVTCADLDAEARAGRFRDDLLHLLKVVPLAVPPLREHVEDVPDLLGFFVDHLVEREGLRYRRFTVAAQNRLRNHGWPGNVRELRNLVQRLLVLGEGVDIDVGEVNAALEESRRGPAAPVDLVAGVSLDQPLREAREEFERLYLQHQLRRAEGSVARLARLTGMERTHLYRKLRALGIDPKEGGGAA